MSSQNERTGEIKVDGFTFTWEIEDFEYQCEEVGESIRSPYFQIRYPVSLSSYRWYFTLYPYGKSEVHEDCVSVYLHIASPDNDPGIKLSCKIAILNLYSNVEAKFTRDVITLQRNHWFGSHSLITREELFNKSDSLLVDDMLIIKCTVELEPYCKNEPNSTLGSDLQEMYSTGKYSDITIQVGRRKIKAHKNILAARSRTFANIIKKMKPEDGITLIKITDFNYEVMNEVLTFIYCDKVSDIKQYAKPLLQAAYHYGLDRLKIICENSLWSAISISRAIETLKVAKSCYCPELKSKTMKFITDNMKEVVKTSGFTTLKYEDARLLEEIVVATQKN